MRHTPRMLRTALICTTAGADIVGLVDAKRHLNIETGDFDAKVTQFCGAATRMLDGADGHLKRALRTQGWRLVLPSFYAACDHYGRIALPLPPLQAVTAIKYLDVSAVEQTLASSTYRVVNNGTEKSFVMLAPGQVWPLHGWFPDAVRIEFTAGYGDDTAAVPADICNAAYLNLSHLYEFRGDDAAAPEMPLAAKRLVFNYRILGL